MNCTPIRCLAADNPLLYQSWFYLTPSHYLSHKMYYYSYLVMIALGRSRNLMVYCRRFTSTKRLYFNLIILCLIIQDISLPFRVYILTDKIFMIPQFVQNKTFTHLVWD
uniref:Uncharacterized protein n=1 Tax=Ophiocordyceps sinensis TaxID=72228 RepID=A0A1W5T0K8_9HYPO|nr:hypothetical protein [Ophiocordyceps sinensis]ARF03361.1 hypothetical protein [Ophiocordyceps sinensis]QDH07209.1 hypothetical protein [Ophiocordyceps sinensis]